MLVLYYELNPNIYLSLATCTWTRLDGIVQLRPQFSHIDALNEQSSSAARQERNDEGKGREDRAEDVNMIIKDTADNENVDMYGGMGETAKLLRAMRDEPWQSLKWFDQSVSTFFSFAVFLLIPEGHRIVRHVRPCTKISGE